MIASKQAGVIKQTNTFIQKKQYRLPHSSHASASAMCIGIYPTDLMRVLQASIFYDFKLRSTTEQMPALVYSTIWRSAKRLTYMAEKILRNCFRTIALLQVLTVENLNAGANPTTYVGIYNYNARVVCRYVVG
jgi:hypothetical protein